MWSPLRELTKFRCLYVLKCLLCRRLSIVAERAIERGASLQVICSILSLRREQSFPSQLTFRAAWRPILYMDFLVRAEAPTLPAVSLLVALAAEAPSWEQFQRFMRVYKLQPLYEADGWEAALGFAANPAAVTFAEQAIAYLAQLHDPAFEVRSSPPSFSRRAAFGSGDLQLRLRERDPRAS